MENYENKTESLRLELTRAGININDWGIGQAKTLEHLQKEIDEGEATLITNENGEILRSIVVGGADVYYTSPENKTYRLKEEKQVFKDGRERSRDLEVALSEKMKPGEEPETAMIRGIKEELGILGDIQITELGSETEIKPSQSYPGLRTQYKKYMYKVLLTQSQFNPIGYIEEQLDKNTYFIWEEI